MANNTQSSSELSELQKAIERLSQLHALSPTEMFHVSSFEDLNKVISAAKQSSLLLSKLNQAETEINNLQRERNEMGEQLRKCQERRYER